MNANEMHPAADTNSARRALMLAVIALDKGHVAVAGAWAETAVDVIRDAQLDADEQRQLVAPKDGPTKGDIAVLTVVTVVIVWLVFDSLRVLL